MCAFHIIKHSLFQQYPGSYSLYPPSSYLIQYVSLPWWISMILPCYAVLIQIWWQCSWGSEDHRESRVDGPLLGRRELFYYSARWKNLTGPCKMYPIIFKKCSVSFPNIIHHNNELVMIVPLSFADCHLSNWSRTKDMHFLWYSLLKSFVGSE